MRQTRERMTAQHFAQPTTDAIAGNGAELKSGNDDGDARVRHVVGTPCQFEMRALQPPAFFPAGRELRAARSTQPRATRQPLARLATPVFGRQPDREALAALLATPREHRASPNIFHPRAESVFVDATPIARPICRTHLFCLE
jgi:hypothetical protein